MSTLTETEYSALLHELAPRVIRSEAQHESYTEVLEELCARKKLTRDEVDLVDLLTLLIEEYEEKRYRLKPAKPTEIIRELMAARGWKQKDLAPVFGTTSIVSDVLNGKRQLTLEHVRRLSRTFHVSPEVFIPEWPPARAKKQTGTRARAAAERENNA
jgi:HTH-type transcriptional regulator/antitoxin HigA